jgi:hypothetical protein
MLRLGRRTSARLVGRHHCTTATLYYQGPEVPRSLTSTGLVGTNRDVQGSDGEFFGVTPTPTVTSVRDGRGQPFSLDENGFCRVDHAWAHVDYYDNEAILGKYYSECEALVARHTGASRVLAFDHNLRARARKAAADSLKGAGANAVQEPLITYGVHNDYTLASAPRRIEQLSQPRGPNDTLRVRLEQGASSPIAADEVERLLSGRWQFINVWRNVSPEPVARAPLALCDAQSVSADDLVVFEIRCACRTWQRARERRCALRRVRHGARWHARLR